MYAECYIVHITSEDNTCTRPFTNQIPDRSETDEPTKGNTKDVSEVHRRPKIKSCLQFIKSDTTLPANLLNPYDIAKLEAIIPTSLFDRPKQRNEL